MIPSSITSRHLARTAIIYLRSACAESAPATVDRFLIPHQLIARLLQWGWPLDHIRVIDEGAAVPGTGAPRSGFTRVIEEMTREGVGMVLVSDLSRLGRNEVDLARFMKTARLYDVLVGCGEQVVDLQHRTTKSEPIRFARAKQRHAGVGSTRPPLGYVVDRGRTWMKDPNRRVDTVVRRVFRLVQRRNRQQRRTSW